MVTYKRTTTGLLLVVAVIHLLPISGVLGVERLAALYGVEIADPDLEILMRHRAILFGILGGFLAYAVFRPAFQPIAFVAAFVSVVSFIFVALSVGEFNSDIRRVIIADIVALVCLFGAMVSYLLQSSR